MSDSATTDLGTPSRMGWRIVSAIAAVLLLVVLGQASAVAGEGGEARYFIADIRVDGLVRTEPEVIYRELLVHEGDTASSERIEESVQRVRNTGVFRKVRYELVDASGQEPIGDLPADVEPVVLQIHIDEQWTASPIFSYARGGGTYRLVLGAYDDNFLGRYIGIGAQYERLGDTNSFYAWAFDPRLFDQRLRAGVDVGTRNRVYTLYEPGGELDGGFLLNRFTVGAHVRKEWKWWLRTQVALRYNNDDFSYDLIGDPLRQLQRQSGLPPASHTLFGSVTGLLGRIDQDNYLRDGTLFSVTVEHANAALGSSVTLTDVVAGLSDFERLPLDSNLGMRIAAGAGDLDAVQHRFYLGGLDGIRGFPSDRFSGQCYWMANLEYRIPSLDTRWVVLQHIFFVDAAGVSESVADLATLSGASAGIGLRFIVPKIHDFVARIDYAFALYGDASNPLSLGGGQFF